MKITPHPLVLLVTASLAFLITLILRRVCERFMLLDFPDARKIHMEPVPYLGGVAVYLAAMLDRPALHLTMTSGKISSAIRRPLRRRDHLLLGIFDDLGA